MAELQDVRIRLEVFPNAEALPEAEQQLVYKAREAAGNAYAPYSNFFVGAALLLEDGSTHLGNNQENAAYPSGLCAERTALFGFSANNSNRKIEAIAVAARRSNETEFRAVTPCGACRQVMIEYEHKQQQPIKIILPGPEGKFYRLTSVSDLLPLQFNIDHL